MLSGAVTLRAWSDPPCTRLSFHVKRCNRSCQSQLCDPDGLGSLSYSQVILAASFGKAIESSSPDAAFSAKKSALRRTVTKACATRMKSRQSTAHSNCRLLVTKADPWTLHRQSQLASVVPVGSAVCLCSVTNGRGVLAPSHAGAKPMLHANAALSCK